MDAGTPLIILGVVLGVAALVVVIVLVTRAVIARNARIRAEFVALAVQQGWEFIERDMADRPYRYKGFKPFGVGDARRAEQVLTGAFGGYNVDLFNYHYEETSGSGKDRHTTVYRFRVAAIDMPVSGPDLTLHRETLGDKIYDAFGGEDIDFESDDFSRKFWVKCNDRKFAYDTITPAMMEWLLPLAHSGASWQWRGMTLIVAAPGHMGPEEYLGFLQFATGFRERLPRVLLPEVLKSQVTSGKR